MSNNKYKNFIPQGKKSNPYVKKGGKLKPSFWIVLAFMIFWTIGSVFGIFTTVKGCNGTSSSSMKTVSADSINSFRTMNLYSDESGFYQDSFWGTGSSSSVMASPFIINCKYYNNFDQDWNVAIVSTYQFGGYDLDYHYWPDSGLFLRFTDGDEYPFFLLRFLCRRDGVTKYFYGLSGSTIEPNDVYLGKIPDYILWKGSGKVTDFYFDFDICTGRLVKFTETYFRMYSDYVFSTLFEESVDIGYELALDRLNNFLEGSYVSYEAYFSNSSFGHEVVSATHLDTVYNEDRSVSYSVIYSNICNKIPSGFTIKDLYKVDFSVCMKRYNVKTDMRFYLDGDGKNSYENCKFIFSSGVYQNGNLICDTIVSPFINKKDEYYDVDYYSNLELINVINKVHSNYDLTSLNFTITDNFEKAFNCKLGLLNTDFVRGYDQGYSDGKSRIEDDFKDRYIDQGYQEGYNVAYNKFYIARYNEGYNTAVENNTNFTFLSLVGSVVDAPIKAISGLLDFNLLGFNMLNFFFALCTCALIIAVVRMFL